MSTVRFDQDYHVHSTYSDDAQSTLEENLREAEWAGLRTICMVDHVRRATTYVPDMVAAVRALRPMTGIEILCGVETKIMNRAGDLDLPALLSVDHVLIADHQYPSDDGPLAPSVVRSALAAGTLSAREAIECIVDASVAAMSRVERPVMAHPFSLLPKIGLDESFVTARHLQHFAQAARRHGALVEVNEKWNCPGPRLVSELLRAEVHLVAGSDAHHCESVGNYQRVRETIAAVEHRPPSKLVLTGR